MVFQAEYSQTRFPLIPGLFLLKNRSRYFWKTTIQRDLRSKQQKRTLSSTVGAVIVADVHTPQKRSFNMSRIKSRDTRPERIVRSLAHSLGYRFRLYSKDLPGKPDLVFPGRRKVLFVHGCFFHMHRCRYGRVVPKTNAEFWHIKRSGNAARDKRKARWFL